MTGRNNSSPLAGETSLLQQAFDRLEGLVPPQIGPGSITNTLQAEAKLASNCPP